MFQQDVEVEVTGTDRYDRTLGRIWLGNRDINRELVAEGYAWAYRDYLTDMSLLEDEKSAREERLGLWSMASPVPPWQWRRGSRSSSIATVPPDTSGCGAKRTCGQMSSCEEAMHYFQQCGLSRLDGDNDGVPCESICR